MSVLITGTICYIYYKWKKKIGTSLGYLVAGCHHRKLICQVVTQKRNQFIHFSVSKFCKLVTQNSTLNEELLFTLI